MQESKPNFGSSDFNQQHTEQTRKKIARSPKKWVKKKKKKKKIEVEGAMPLHANAKGWKDF